jgi:hypothetical protein
MSCRLTSVLASHVLGRPSEQSKHPGRLFEYNRMKKLNSDREKGRSLASMHTNPELQRETRTHSSAVLVRLHLQVAVTHGHSGCRWLSESNDYSQH